MARPAKGDGGRRCSWSRRRRSPVAPVAGGGGTRAVGWRRRPALMVGAAAVGAAAARLPPVGTVVGGGAGTGGRRRPLPVVAGGAGGRCLLFLGGGGVGCGDLRGWSWSSDRRSGGAPCRWRRTALPRWRGGGVGESKRRRAAAARCEVGAPRRRRSRAPAYGRRGGAGVVWWRQRVTVRAVGEWRTLPAWTRNSLAAQPRLQVTGHAGRHRQGRQHGHPLSEWMSGAAALTLVAGGAG